MSIHVLAGALAVALCLAVLLLPAKYISGRLFLIILVLLIIAAAGLQER